MCWWCAMALTTSLVWLYLYLCFYSTLLISILAKASFVVSWRYSDPLLNVPLFKTFEGFEVMARWMSGPVESVIHVQYGSLDYSFLKRHDSCRKKCKLTRLTNNTCTTTNEILWRTELVAQNLLIRVPADNVT